MSTHVPASAEPFDPEDAIRRLDAAVAAIGTRGTTPATIAQATRLLDILAGEVRADDPLPEIAGAAGAGLQEIARPWDDVGPQMAADVAGLLDVVGRRASEPGSGAGDRATTATTRAPERRGPSRGIDFGAAADDDEEASDEGSSHGGGPAGIGAPILPTGRGRG